MSENSECIGGAQHDWIEYNNDGIIQCTQCRVIQTKPKK